VTIAEIFQTMEYGPAPESSDPAEAWLDAHHREILPSSAVNSAGRRRRASSTR